MPTLELHPDTWLKILQEKKDFFDVSKFEHLSDEVFIQAFDCIHHPTSTQEQSSEELNIDLLNQACAIANITPEEAISDFDLNCLDDSKCEAEGLVSWNWDDVESFLTEQKKWRHKHP